MALFAPDRAFVLFLMAGNAEGMSGLFIPIYNFTGIGGMAAKAFIFYDFLVFPVGKRKEQVSHFELDDFRPLIRRRFCRNSNSPTSQRHEKNRRCRMLYHLIAPL
jgi:hypothetical protein